MSVTVEAVALISEILIFAIHCCIAVLVDTADVARPHVRVNLV